MRDSKCFYNLILIITLVSFIVYPQAKAYTNTVSSFEQHHMAQSWQLDNMPFTYNSILELLDDIETGKLEKICSLEELKKVNHFLALLALNGLLPTNNDTDAIVL